MSTPTVPPRLAGSWLLAPAWRWAHRLPLAPSFTYAREPDEERGIFRFGPSYLAMRVVIGLVGLAMPCAVVALDVLVEGRIGVRGSVSAYYFSASRDVFVGCLSAVGFLLVTYMWSYRRTLDFVASVVAGVGVLVVAHVPTRPGAPTDELSWVQDAVGVDPARVVHVVAAGAFVACSIVLSLVYALRELRFAVPRCDDLAAEDAALRRFWTYVALAGATALGAALLLVSTFVGELVAFTSFALSWLVASRVLRRFAGLRPRAGRRRSDPTARAPNRP